MADGLCLWFDTELTEGVSFSNAPGQPKAIYGQAVFPLESPTAVAPGDEITVSIETRLVEDDYEWRWRTRIADPDGVQKAAFDQSTLRGLPLSLARLRRIEAGHRPELGEDGQIEHLALSLMDGQTALEEIAGRLVERFPERFPTQHEALRRVARLSNTFGA